MRLNKNSASLCCLACLAAVPLLACVQRATPARPSFASAPVPSPAVGAAPVKFTLVSMTVVPQEVEYGESAQAVVTLQNSGAIRSAYVGTLYADGQEYGRQDITLSPGQAGTLVFPVSLSGPGTHRLTMAGLEGTLRVYTVERHTLTNSDVHLPHYTNVESTPLPPVPHTSVNSFSPPMRPFYITRINFRVPFPQSFSIVDENNRQLYSSGLTHIDTAFVPNIEVNGDFSIQMQTDQRVADVRVQWFGYYAWSEVIEFLWPQVSTLEGFQKRFDR